MNQTRSARMLVLGGKMLPAGAVGRLLWRCAVAALALAGLFSGCNEEGQADDSATETSDSALVSSGVTPEGQLSILVASGPFEFAFLAPLAALTKGQELDLSDLDGGKLRFTAMVPVEGEPEDTTGENCEEYVDESGEVHRQCVVPYPGFGYEEPMFVDVPSKSGNGLALVYFHELGEHDGELLAFDYLIMYAHEIGPNVCQPFLDYSTRPIEFVIGESASETIEEFAAFGQAVSGPVFPIDLKDNTGPAEPGFVCSLDLFPQPFKDFCPMPGSLQGTGLGNPNSHWFQRCSKEFPEMPGYPVE